MQHCQKHMELRIILCSRKMVAKKLKTRKIEACTHVPGKKIITSQGNYSETQKVGMEEVRAGRWAKNFPSLVRPQIYHGGYASGSHLFFLHKWQLLLSHSISIPSQLIKLLFLLQWNVPTAKILNSFSQQKTDPACSNIRRRLQPGWFPRQAWQAGRRTDTRAVTHRYRLPVSWF